MPQMTASGDDAGVGAKVPSAPVDPSRGTKTALPKKTTSASSSKDGAAAQGEKDTETSKALVLKPLPKLTAPRKLQVKEGSRVSIFILVAY